MAEDNEKELGFKVFEDVEENMDNEYGLRKESAKNTIPTGVDYIDACTNGVREDDLIIIGAKTGAGKTEFASIICSKMSEKGKKVYCFALEGSRMEQERRAKYREISKLYYQGTPTQQINYADWLECKLDNILGKYEDQANSIVKRKLKNVKYYYRKKDFDTEDLKKLMLFVQDDADVIVLDHIHMVSHEHANENTGVKKIIDILSETAFIMKKPIIAISHVRKSDNKWRNHFPTIEDLHGSSEIFKKATKVIILADASKYLGESLKDARFKHEVPTLFHVAKNRTYGAVVPWYGLVNFNYRENEYQEGFLMGKIETIDKEEVFVNYDKHRLPGKIQNYLEEEDNLF